MCSSTVPGTLSGDDLVTKNAGRMRIKARAVDVIDVEATAPADLCGRLFKHVSCVCVCALP